MKTALIILGVWWLLAFLIRLLFLATQPYPRITSCSRAADAGWAIFSVAMGALLFWLALGGDA